MLRATGHARMVSEVYVVTLCDVAVVTKTPRGPRGRRRPGKVSRLHAISHMPCSSKQVPEAAARAVQCLILFEKCEEQDFPKIFIFFNPKCPKHEDRAH